LPASTRRNLELTQTLRGDSASNSPTLFALLDTCMTGMGSRLLKSWLLSPPRDRQTAIDRLRAQAVLRGESVEGSRGAWSSLREQLKGASDVERITARTALRQVRPRELVALRHALARAAALSTQLQALNPEPGTLLAGMARWLTPPTHCAELLQMALLEEPSSLVRDGGVIADGLDAELDELRGIQTNCDAFLLDLETREKERTGIANLRVQFNKVHGRPTRQSA
jgi:DNA mismatch repair protein MutS